MLRSTLNHTVSTAVKVVNRLATKAGLKIRWQISPVTSDESLNGAQESHPKFVETKKTIAFIIPPKPIVEKKPTKIEVNLQTQDRGHCHESSSRNIVIDGLNVIYGAGSNNAPNLLNLFALIRELQQLNYKFKCYFDPGTFYTLKRKDKDQAYAYRRLVCDFPQYFTEVPPCQKADDYILDYAHSHGTSIISNDRYRDFEIKYSWIKTDSSRRLAFINDTVMLQILPLGIQAMIPNELANTERLLRKGLGETNPSQARPKRPVRPEPKFSQAWAHA